jgi:hypothetical protein
MTTRKQITAKYTGKCSRCGGTIPSGTTCTWAQGEGIRHINCTVTAVAKHNDVEREILNAEIANVVEAQRNEKSVSVTMGVFKKDGRIYVVKPNKEKTRVYAKEIVESPARMTESGMKVDFEARYAPGIVFKLTEADRWDLADAKDFLTKFARCIVCGRHLKAAKSVERSIGPVCAGYFRSSSHVNGCAHHDAAAPTGAAAAADVVVEDEGQRNEADEMSDDAKNALLIMTDDQEALLAEIKRMNEVSRRWQAAGPDRWASMLTEDIAYWSKSGINSLADFNEMQRLEDAKEARKASYDWEPPTQEQLDRAAEHNREWQEIRAQVDADLRAERISGVKSIDPKFRLAIIKQRNAALS